MISKATSVYIIMLVVFGAGLWAILSVGSILLQAPTDLAGQWELHDPNTNPTTDGGDTVAAHKMTIDQSGRYFQITIDQQRFSLKQAAHEVLDNPTGPDAVLITVGSGPNELTFFGLPDGDEYQLESRGPAVGTWRAIRTARTYPKRSNQQSAAKPTTRLAHS